MLIVILVAIIGTFGYNFTVMLPLLDRYVLDRGRDRARVHDGALSGSGALISALVLASRGDGDDERCCSPAALPSRCCSAQSRSASGFALTLLFLFLLGLANTAFASTANTSLQLATPDHLRGRVMALYMLLFAGSTPIGGYLTGVMAEAWGVQTAIGIEAGICLLGVAAGLFYYARHRTAIGRVAAMPVGVT